MKTRNGFVSNSSSSSFVIVAPKDIVDNVLKTLTPYEQEVAKYVQICEKEFMGKMVTIFQGSTGNDDSWEYGFEFTGEKSEIGDIWDAWELFVSELKKTAKENIIINKIDS